MFGEKISNHVISWEILNIEFSIFDAVCYEKVPDVDMSGTLRAKMFPVVLQEYGRLVVLVHDSDIYTIVLCIQKVVGPEELRHEIIRSNKLSSSRYPGIKILLGG